MLRLNIAVDDLSDGGVVRLLQDHRQEMLKHSPPESVHALDVDSMHSLDLTFWSASIDGCLVGCTALKQLDSAHAEVKSMKVSDNFVGKGVGRALINHLLIEAKRRAYKRLSLETGTMSVFIPARGLYESLGFTVCDPFGNYVEDPHSVCMTLEI